jgi:hypothetical protein
MSGKLDLKLSVKRLLESAGNCKVFDDTTKETENISVKECLESQLRELFGYPKEDSFPEYLSLDDVENLIFCMAIEIERYSEKELYMHRLQQETEEKIKTALEKNFLDSLSSEQSLVHYYMKHYGRNKEQATSTGFVYIAKQLNESDIYKIGASKNVQQREKTFRIGNIYVEIIATKNSNKPFEQELLLHKLFKIYHIKGEWYRIPQDIFDKLIKYFSFNLCLSKPFDLFS